MNKILRAAVLATVAAGITFGAVSTAAAGPSLVSVGSPTSQSECAKTAEQRNLWGPGQPGIHSPDGAYSCQDLGNGKFQLRKTA